MTSAFRDHSVSVRSLPDPSVSLLRGTPRTRCEVVGLSEEAEETAGVRLTMRAGGLGGTRREKTVVQARGFFPLRWLVLPPSR